MVSYPDAFELRRGRSASREKLVVRSIFQVGLAAGLALLTLISRPVAAQTFYSFDMRNTCSTGQTECSAGFEPPSHDPATLMDRISCRIELRTEAGRKPRPTLLRVVLLNILGSGAGESDRQPLSFEKSFESSNRAIFVVATDPMFRIGHNSTGKIVVTTQRGISSIVIDCHVTGHKS